MLSHEPSAIRFCRYVIVQEERTWRDGKELSMYVRGVVCKPLARVLQWASGEMPKASDGLVVALATFFPKHACPADCGSTSCSFL